MRSFVVVNWPLLKVDGVKKLACVINFHFRIQIQEDSSANKVMIIKN